jgi:hypothetical protein
MESSHAAGELRRLASLLVAVATLLLLIFVLSVALPLLPLKLADPFWQLAFTSALSSHGFLALLAVLLVNLAVVLVPEAYLLIGYRQLVAGLCRWVALGFLLLIPLQAWAVWQVLERVGAIDSRDDLQELARMTLPQQAAASAASVSALQTNLAVIQAPLIGPEDQRQAQVASRLTALLKDSLRTLLLSMAFALAGVTPILWTGVRAPRRWR